MILGRNILWNLASFIWLSLLLILVTPYMVAKLGLEAFGVWSVLMAFVAYLAMVDFGLANALIRFIAVEHEQGDRVALTRFIRSGLTMQLAIGLVASICFFTLASLIVRNWLHVAASLAPQAIAAFRVSAIAVGLAFPVATFASIPAALHRFDLLAGRVLLLYTLQFGLFVVVLKGGGGLLSIAVVNVGVLVVVLAYLLAASIRLLPGVPLYPGWHTPTVQTLLRFGRFKFPAQISASLLQQLDRIVLAGLVPLAQVTYYAVPARLSLRVSQVVEQIATPYYPSISAHLVAGRTDALRREYLVGSRLVGAVAGAAMAVLGGFAYPLLHLWMGKDFAIQGAWPLRILLVTYSASALAVLPSVASDAALRPGIPAAVLAAGAVTHAALLFIGIPRLGLIGAALAVLVGFLVPLLVGVPLIHRKVDQLPAVRAVARDLRGTLVATLGAGILSVLVARTSYPASGIVPLLLSLTSALAAYAALLFLFRGVRTDDVRRLRQLVRGMANAAHPE